MVRWWRVLAAAVVLVATSIVIGPSASATGTVGWLHTDRGTIKTAAGRPYVIKAVAWFGMETPNCAPHGLWQIGLDDGLAQIASFGFNTVRLPFSNECLRASATTGIDAHLNPELAGLPPLDVMDQVVARARAHGLSIILDRHRPDSGAQSPLWYTATVPESRWIADWRSLARRYADDPTVIGVDLHNEPHGEACWGCGDASRDWAAAAGRAGDAVLAENPRLLVIVEGVEHQGPPGTGRSTWWGGGLADASRHPVRLSVADRLVYSPHDYPSSIFPQPWFSDPTYPTNLTAQWRADWGYLVEDGIAPVLLGEFGTRLQTVSDRQWLAALVEYLDRTGASFAYWSFNPNSGDTGGLVGDDWTTPQRAKLEALRPLLGAAPPPAPSSTPSPSASPSSGPSASASPRPSSSPSPRPSSTPFPAAPGPHDLAAAWRVTSAWSGGYVAEITLRSDAGRSGWTIDYADPAAGAVVNAWGMACEVAGGRIRCVGRDWGAEVPPAGQLVVGLQVATGGEPPVDPVLDVR